MSICAVNANYLFGDGASGVRSALVEFQYGETTGLTVVIWGARLTPHLHAILGEGPCESSPTDGTGL